MIVQFCDLCGSTFDQGSANVISFFKCNKHIGENKVDGKTFDKPYYALNKANPRLEVCDYCFNELVNTVSYVREITRLEKSKNDRTATDNI